MTFETLAEDVDFLEEADQLDTVEGADWKHETGALTTIMMHNRPSTALLFDDIKEHGSGYRVLTNALTTAFQWTAAMGFEPVTSKREAIVLQKDAKVSDRNRQTRSILYRPSITFIPAIRSISLSSPRLNGMK